MSLTKIDASSPEDDVVHDDTLLRRQLVNDFSATSICHMKVYLRVRPLSTAEVESNECLFVESGQSVVMKAPELSATFRNHSANDSKLKQRFTFTSVFGPHVDQRAFFSGAVLNTVSEFLNGQNCLVFAYGTTNSGKTFTVQGSESKPGIIPHAVDVIFNSIGPKQDNDLRFQPLNSSSIVMLSSKEMTELTATRDQLLKGIEEFYRDSSSHMSDQSASLFDNTTTDQPITEPSIDERDSSRFNLWISFAEIYNENIYDLLDKCPEKRKCLKLSVDRTGNTYIKGLKILPASSPRVARQLLTLGRKNLHISSTKLNQSSSRSHCIYTLYLVRVVDTPDPEQAMITSLSFCDLAGSERVEKTQNTGERLKEAGKINNSLMVFGRCIEALRNAQNSKERPVVPFRDSKLTQLFQFFFNGKGRASMIVNVSPTSKMFDDTANVLKVSAIAQQVVSDQLERTLLNITSSSQRLTNLWPLSGQRWSSFSKGRNVQRAMSIMTEKEDSVEEEEEEKAETVEEEPDIQELIDFILDLEVKYNALVDEKTSLQASLKRQRDEFQEHMDDLAKSHRERIQFAKENMEKYYEKRLELAEKALTLKYKYSESSGDDEQDADESTEDAEISELKQKNGDLSKLVEDLQKKIDELEFRVQVKTLELTVSSEREASMTAQVRTLSDQLASKGKESAENSELQERLCQQDKEIEDLKHQLAQEQESKRETVASLQAAHAKKVSLLEEELQSMSLKISQAERHLEKGKKHMEQRLMEMQSENDRKIRPLEQKLQSLITKVSVAKLRNETSEQGGPAPKRLKSLEDELSRTKQKLVMEISRADNLQSCLRKAEEKCSRSTEELSKMGDILFDKDAEINTLTTKLQDLEGGNRFQENSLLLEKKDAEISLLRAQITTLERINTSDDFKAPSSRTRKRRKAVNENSAPKDDTSESNLSVQSDDSSLNKSPSVLRARNTGETVDNKSTSYEAPPSGSARKLRRKMYEKDSCAPLECTPPKQTNQDSSVHSIVTRQLRNRK